MDVRNQSRFRFGLAGWLLALLTAPAFAQIGGLSPGQSQRTVRVHDVRDLLVEIKEFPVKRFNRPKTEPGGEAAVRGPSPRELLLRSLNAYLQKKGIPRRAYTLRLPIPGTLPGRKPSTPGSLIVEATESAHRAVAVFLDRERRLVEQVIQVAVRIFRIKDPEADLPERLADEPLGEKDTIFFLTAEQAGLLVQEFQASRNVVQITAPRITVLNRQRANVMIANQLAYIAEYQRVKVLGEETSVLDPVIRTLDEGVAVEIKVELQPEDLSRARVEVFYQNAELERPIARKKTAHGEIQIPRIESVDLEFDANIALPGQLLLASKTRPKIGVDLILLSFKRHGQEEVWKNVREAVAPVIGISPGREPSGAMRFFVRAGRNAGLEKGMRVRFRRSDRKDAALLFAGVVEKVYHDLAVVKASLEGLDLKIDFHQATSWMCEFKVKHRKVKPSRKKL